jgi:amino acid adenylation domain-containing protein
VRTYASILAILASGSAYVPLNRKNPADRNKLIAERAELDLVLATRAGPEIEALRAVLPRVEVIYTETLPSSGGLAWSDRGELAYLFFTSGTTGVPKGVPIRHSNLAAFMNAVVDESKYAFTADDRFLQMFELTFDLSVMSFLVPLCVGASCHVVPDSGIASLNIAGLLEEREITVALMVPSVLSYLQRYFDELSFPSLRHSLFCGEALSHRLTADWKRCVPTAEMRNVYGPTEATIFCTEFVWQEAASAAQSVNDVVPIGKCIPGTDALVVDSACRPVAAGERGELVLLGAQLAAGYWGDPKQTADAFITLRDGRAAYRTGDVCFLNDSGNFVYCGRADSQIQVDGHRVELGEVEHHLRSFMDGKNAAAVPIRTDDGRQEFVAFVECAEGEESGARQYLAEKLPPYMLPRQVVSVASFPLSLNGKVDRKVLLQRYLAAK